MTQPRRVRGIPRDDDASRVLRRYDESFLTCRDLRHPWELVGYWRDHDGIHRRLECPRCDMIRVDAWSTLGERLGCRYLTPEGYRISGHEVHLADVRREALRRASVYDSESDLLG